MYLIATFPSKKYNIDQFPAVKNFLNGFKPKLNQTGVALTEEEKDSVINYARLHGIDINRDSLKKSRKKTQNKWFETQDSIAYWEDFSKQKIVFQEMVQESSFILDYDGKFVCLDTARIITGSDLDILIAILNSDLFYYAIKTFYGGGALGETGVRMKHTFFEKFPIPNFSDKEKSVLSKLILKPIENLKRIDEIIYNTYMFTEEEVKIIGAQ